jgi:hypothetical protein
MVIITTLTRVKSNQKLIWVCWTLLVPLFGYIGFLEFHFENYMWKENSVLLFLSHVVSNQVSLIYRASSLDISCWLRHRNLTSTKPHMSTKKKIPQRHVLWQNLLVTCCNQTNIYITKPFGNGLKQRCAVLWIFKEPPVLVLEIFQNQLRTARWFLWENFRIKELPVPVLPKTLKIQQFSWKNWQRTGDICPSF